MSFYRLPNPYNPHYAIPDYIMSEPPERGTFTTEWLPRGTIPLMVPDFLAQTHSGQMGKLGVFAKNSLHGSIFDENVFGQSYDLRPAPAPSAPQQIAAAIISKVKKLAPHRRANALRTSMKKIHPALPAKTQVIARQLQRKGVHPSVALQHGLATAIARLTTTSAASPSQTQVIGSGSSQLVRQQLGGTYVPAGDLPAGIAPVQIVAASTATVPTDGQCTTAADGSTFVWHNGAWTRLRVGEQCQGTYTGTATIRTGSGSTAGVSSPVPFTQGDYFTGVFWLISKNKHAQEQTGYLTDPSVLPPDWVSLVQAVVQQTGTRSIDESIGMIDPYNPARPNTLAAYRAWLSAFGLPEPGPGVCYKALPPTSCCPATVETSPVWTFTDGGTRWFFSMELAVPGDVYQCGCNTSPSKNTLLKNYPNQPLGLLISCWYPKDQNWMPGWMNDFASIFADPASAIAKSIADIAGALGMTVCQMVNNPAALATAMKSNPGAAAALVAASAACTSAGATPKPPPPPKPSMLPTLLLLGGAGVIAIVALRR